MSRFAYPVLLFSFNYSVIYVTKNTLGNGAPLLLHIKKYTIEFRQSYTSSESSLFVVK